MSNTDNNERVDFGQSFIDRKQLQERFGQFQAQRRVHASAIYRERGQLDQNCAVEMPKGVLEIRLKNLNNNYSGFVNEHKSLMAVIQQKDKIMIKEQENYAVQVENVYLRSAGELQELINDKEFLSRSVHEQNPNQGNCERSQKGEMSKKAETVLKNVRKELDELRAEKNAMHQKGKKSQPVETQSTSKRPLEQLMAQYSDDSDTDLEDNSGLMTNEEVEKELKRYDTKEPLITKTNQQSKSDEQNKKNDDANEPMIASSAEVNESGGNYPRSTVQVVNHEEHSDLRSKLKMKREPLHYEDRSRPKPYYTGERRIPNRVISCFNCNGQHAMSKCQLFDELRPAERRARVNQLELCENCFSPMLNEYGRRHVCRSGMCRRCRKAFHNSKLCGE